MSLHQIEPAGKLDDTTTHGSREGVSMDEVGNGDDLTIGRDHFDHHGRLDHHVADHLASWCLSDVGDPIVGQQEKVHASGRPTAKHTIGPIHI